MQALSVFFVFVFSIFALFTVSGRSSRGRGPVCRVGVLATIQKDLLRFTHNKRDPKKTITSSCSASLYGQHEAF